jgi:hypothetical protein
LLFLNFIAIKKANTEGRLDGLKPNLETSVESFVASGYLGIYAGWGSIWVIIILIFRTYAKNKLI